MDDPDRDAATRSELRAEVEPGRGRRPRRSGVATAGLALLGVLAIGGAGYVIASAAPDRVSGSRPAVPASAVPTNSLPAPVTPAPVRSSQPPVGHSVPATPAALAAPVITVPAAGQTFAGGSAVTIAGTGTPGASVFVLEYCTLAPPACTEPAELGQSSQTPIVVGPDGRWSTTQTLTPPQRTGFRLTASQAQSGAAGASARVSPQSASRTFTVNGPDR